MLRVLAPGLVRRGARWPTSNDTDRTEDPTQKRLDEALERGDVVKSQEVNDLVRDRRRDAGADRRSPAA